MDDAAAQSSPPGRRRHSSSRRARRKERLAKRSKLRRRLTRAGIALVALIVLIAGGGIGYYYYRTDQIRHIVAPHIVVAKGPTENILLIGSTSRCAASSIALYRQECTSGVNGINSDVVLIAHLNGTAHTISLLSIPRDAFVPGARNGTPLCGSTSPLTPNLCPNKIDAALVEGPDQLIAAVEQDFGIPINHFVDLNFATFTNVVNALGGIKLYFPDRLFDASSFLKITKTGCQLLNGTQALALVRSRHLYYFTKGQTPNYTAIQAVTNAGTYYTANSGGSYDGTGDLGRIVRVHLFLKALAQQVAARGLGNPITDNNLIGAVAPNLTVDSGLSPVDMVHLLLDFRHANFGSAPELTLPTITYGQTYYYNGANYGDVIFPTQPQDQQVVDQFLGTTPKHLAPGSISVSVVDGTNSASQTASVATALGRLGYKVVPTTASSYVGPVAETTVLYGPGHLAEAQQVMHSLAGTVVLGQGKPVGGAEVSVVAGSDLAVATPATTPRGSASSSSTPASSSSSSSSSTPASSATTTTTPTPVSGNPNYGYNPASAPVPSWDPRSCPTS
jgi:LCP family protein required for cell wall assembly